MTVTVDEAPSAERVACSFGVLTSIVQNMVDNAIKHMDDALQRQVFVHTRGAGGFVRIEVEDTGPGIPRESLTSIFEPFVRGDSTARGTGLGLATVKKLVDAHGGRVGYQSMPGAGSLFWCELPRAAAQAQAG